MNTLTVCNAPLGRSYPCFPREDNRSFVNTLARHGYLVAAPEHPATAFSFDLLRIFMILSTRCPQLSAQAFVKGVCELHGVCHVQHALYTVHGPLNMFQVLYRPHYCNQFAAAFDQYAAIRSEVDRRVAKAMGRDEPHWHLKNACPPCTYALENEPPLRFSMQITMDGNNSQKHVERVQRMVNEAGEVVGQKNIEHLDDRAVSSDYYLSPEEVDQFQHEVKKRLPPLNATVSQFYMAIHADSES